MNQGKSYNQPFQKTQAGCCKVPPWVTHWAPEGAGAWLPAISLLPTSAMGTFRGGWDWLDILFQATIGKESLLICQKRKKGLFSPVLPLLGLLLLVALMLLWTPLWPPTPPPVPVWVGDGAEGAPPPTLPPPPPPGATARRDREDPLLDPSLSSWKRNCKGKNSYNL